MLKNPLYIGKITHKGTIYDGLHQPVIDEGLWDKVQHQIATNSHDRKTGSRSKHPSLLAGKIETEDGQMLTPTHAVKGTVRYRYYSHLRPALKGNKGTTAETKAAGKTVGGTKAGGNSADSKTAKQTLRIPAQAIERLVTDRLLQLMQSQTELAAILEPHNLSATQLREIIQGAAITAEAWAAKPSVEQRAIVQAMLIKVIPRSNRVELILSRHGQMQAVNNPSGSNASQASAAPAFETSASPTLAGETSDNDLVSIYTASGLEPSGNGHRLVIKDASYPKENMHLAPLIGEAFALREALLNDPHDRIDAMSKALQRGKGYIHARIRLTFLSPAIIKNILNGNVPASISATKLLEATKDLPIKWAEQERFIETLAR